ncbi:MAG: BCCT family transporter [Spirochaetes bacterium]|nr:BCCT family transporter [Spirochaetota bacterium]
MEDNSHEEKGKQAFEQLSLEKKNIRWEVMVPGLVVFGTAAIAALINAQALAEASRNFFNWSLETFGWLYAFTVMAATVLVAILCFSKVGNVRIGGKDAKASMPFWTWFVMTLTGGIAVGIVTWSVNEPIIYFGNVWGELNYTGIEPFTTEAYHFALGRSFMHWTFLPYAIYGLCGTLVAYTYFNRKKSLTITSTLEPLFGKRISGRAGSSIIDTLAMLALGLGITSGLAMCVTILTAGINTYGVEISVPLIIIVGVVIVALFTLSSSVGMDKGLRRLGWLNAWFFYGVMALLLILGPTVQIFRNSAVGLAVWFDNFFLWGLDPIDIGGPPLTRAWTMFNWAIWMAYAPVTGIFLGILSKGRTIRELLIVNWVLPSVFGWVWFSIWSTSALEMQLSGQADLVGIISQTGSAVMGLWLFLQNLPFGIGVIAVPLNIFIIGLSYITAADATLTKLGSICVRDVPIGTQPPVLIKVIWGAMIGIVGIVLVAFAERLHGVSGVRELAAAGGFLVLFIFTAMIATTFKVFFVDKIEE